MTAHTPPERRKPEIDWEAIERDYRAGLMTLRQIADEHGVTHGAINKRAKRDFWERDLAAKVQARADALVSKQMVSKEVSKAALVTERQVIESNAQVIADTILNQRADVQAGMKIVASLMSELTAICGPEKSQELETLGLLMRSENDSGVDKLNDLYRLVISLPERSKTAKTLTEALRNLIELQRKILKLDEDPAKQAAQAKASSASSMTDAERAVRLVAMLKQATA
jgi:hypothetical protein